LTFKGDKLVYDPAVLRQNGFLVNTNSANVVSNDSSRTLLTSKQFADNNPEMVTTAGHKD